MTTQLPRRRIGKTTLSVTEMGLGTTPLGNLYRAMDIADAVATVQAAYDGGIRYIDTAPLYGFGLAETRLAQATAPLPRSELVISSKVGYRLEPADASNHKPGIWDRPLPMRSVNDFSRDAVLRSIEGSLQRLKVDALDMVAIHDPDESVFLKPGDDPYAHSHFKEAMEQAYPTLAELRGQGVIKAVGVGMNQWQMLCDFAEAGDFDYFLLAGRYTLLDQDSLARLLPLCEARSISLIIGGPYNSGILATGAAPGATYDYSPAGPEMLNRVRRIETICARHGLPLQAAALQFPLRNPVVAAIIPGARSVDEIASNLGFLNHPIPGDFWAELKAERLIDPASPTG